MLAREADTLPVLATAPACAWPRWRIGYERRLIGNTAGETSTATPHADRGSIITYLDYSDPGNAEFRRAVVTGVGVPDPETGVV